MTNSFLLSILGKTTYIRVIKGQNLGNFCRKSSQDQCFTGCLGGCGEVSLHLLSNVGRSPYICDHQLGASANVSKSTKQQFQYEIGHEHIDDTI